MHINRNMSAVITNNQLLRTENKLARSMERLSSGLKINHASDNPAGIAISNKMKAQIDALDQAEANATDATSVIQIADGALGEVSSILQRMRELSVQAANGTNSQSDRQSIQAEIDQLLKEVDRISRDTEYNTKTLLDGSSDVRVYASNASRFSVSDSVAAQVYKMNVVEAAEQAKVELDYKSPETDGKIVINGIEVDVTSGMSKEEYLQGIRTAAETAGCSVSLDETDPQNQKIVVKSNYYGDNESIQVTMTDELVEKSGLSKNKDCAYEVHGVSVNFEDPAQKPLVDGVIEIEGVKVEITADMTKDEYFSALSKAAEIAGYSAVEDAAGTLTVKAESMKFSYDLAKEFGITDMFDGEYVVDTVGKDALVTIPNDVNDSSVRTKTGFTSTSTVQVDGNRVVITDNGGFSIDFLLDEGFAVGEETLEGNYELEVTDMGSMTIQIGANEHQHMDIRIGEISTTSLYIDTIDVTVEKGANRAMATLDKAIASLSAVRSELGAYQNRLDYAVTSLSSTSENMTAAYSGIMDTDMAKEMTEYTQQNILNQAAISVLSQANELPQQVLSLLQ